MHKCVTYQNVVSVMKGNVLIVSGRYNALPVKNTDFVPTVKIMLNRVNGVVAAVNAVLMAIIVVNHIICMQIKIVIVVTVMIDGKKKNKSVEISVKRGTQIDGLVLG